MREIYGVMAGFALDYYIENKLSVEDGKIVMDYIDKDVEAVTNKIARYIENKLSDEKELLSLLDEYYNNYFVDYLIHFSLVNGQVYEIDEEIKEFILFCNRISEDCVKDIIENILWDSITEDCVKSIIKGIYK